MIEDIEGAVGQYISTWNDPDLAKRRALAEEIWAPDGRYVNGSDEFHGHDGATEAMTRAYDAFVAKGFVFRPIGTPSAHHDGVWFRWGMYADGEDEPASIGSDFVVLGPDDRIRLQFQFIEA